MTQHGQVLKLRTATAHGDPVWAYRYRLGGCASPRVQWGGFESEQAAAEGPARALERLRREQGLVEAPRLRELVEVYLAQHDGEPETIESCAGCSRRPSWCSAIAGSTASGRLRSRRGG